MAVDYEKLGELIDGYGGIAADDLHALPEVCDTRDEEIMLMRADNARLLRQALAEVDLILVGLRGVMRAENARLRQALTEVELILVGLRGVMRAENARLRQALAEVILVVLRGVIANDGDLPGATA